VGSEKTSVVLAPVVNLDSNTSTITIRGNSSTNTATQATIPFNSARVQTRGVSDDLRLVRLNLTGVSFTAPATTSSLSANTTAEGESAASTSSAVQSSQASSLAAPTSGGVEGEGLSSSINSGNDISQYFASQIGQSRSSQNDSVMSDQSDPVSLAAIQSESLQQEGNESLPADAVDAFLASF
jgi:hypothetical protein